MVKHPGNCDPDRQAVPTLLHTKTCAEKMQKCQRRFYLTGIKRGIQYFEIFQIFPP